MGLIKKYETGELIGRGAMGSVYRARDIVLERDVALKMLDATKALDAELKERFYREAKTGANLKHPNIVFVYDLDEHSGVPYIAMEMLNGSDLRRHIAERRFMSLAQKIELCAQVCDGLAEAHRRGVIHRDIKPSNIFIQDDGTAKILDFGIARISSSKLTLAGKVLGSPNYMAPEQIERGKCNERSDLFSAAIVFFEFLVYSHPFRNTFIPSRILTGEPDRLIDHDPLTPLSLVQLLGTALDRDPESRIQTAEQFATKLRGVLQELRTGLAGPAAVGPEIPEVSSKAVGSSDTRRGPFVDFIRMMGEFDRAIDAKDAHQAKAVIDRMAHLEALDGLFSDALRECRGKLQTLESGTPTPPAQASLAANSPKVTDQKPTKSEEAQAQRPVSTRPGVHPCKNCGAPNRSEAQFCLNCGAPLESRISASALSKFFGSLRASVRSLPIRETTDRLNVAVRSKWRHFSLLPRNTQLAVWTLLSCVITGLALYTIVRATKAIPIEASLGTASVQADNSPVWQGAGEPASKLTSLSKDTSVNVLGEITSAAQRFVRVQVIVPKPLRPGYMAISDLRDFRASTAPVAWTYLALRRPTDSLSPAYKAFLSSLRVFSDRFPNSPEARLALIEMVQGYLAFAEQAKSQNQDRSVWQADLDEAKLALATAGVNEQSPEAEKQLVARLRQLEEQNPSKAHPAELPSSEVTDLLRQARNAWASGDVDACENFAQQVLKLEPENQPAKGWMWTVRQSRKQ